MKRARALVALGAALTIAAGVAATATPAAAFPATPAAFLRARAAASPQTPVAPTPAGASPSTPAAPTPAASAPQTPTTPSTVTPGAGTSSADSAAVSSAIAAALAAPDRSPADRALDAQRRPAELLAFFGIAPGMKVAELGAGSGYTAELLARVVGPQGRVYGQNSPLLLERFAQKPWSERLAKPAMTNVVRLDRPLDDPFPPDVRDLDVVLLVLGYHDAYAQQVDVEAMNAAVFRALKPGGVYGIVDHSSVPGLGAEDAARLHRIDELMVILDVEDVGFELDATADFLRNPEDTRDWSASPADAGDKRGTSDRFVLKFVKPENAAAHP